MTYKIYTDASVDIRGGCCSTAYLMLKGNNFFKKGSSIKHNIYNSSSAISEALSLGEALKVFKDTVDISEEDELNIYLDSLYVFKYTSNLINSVKNGLPLIKPKDKTYLLDIFEIISTIKCKVKIFKVKSHSGIINPHSFVDRLAYTTLTNYLW